ncbi:MAG: hypothetical protein AB7E31_15265 [Desulfitobacterium sp.]
MSRKVLLLEPNYGNKYPPMGLMKLSTYFRRRGDNVRFYKGDLKEFAAILLCEEYLAEAQNPLLGKHILRLKEHIKTGRLAPLDLIPDFKDSQGHIRLKEYRKRYKEGQYPKFDIICITTLFTFYWRETINTIEFSKKFCTEVENIWVGGIAATILPEHIFKETGIRPYQGLLNRAGVLDDDSDVIVDELPLDYSILEEIDRKYPASNAYFAYMTRGCPRSCAFCAVPRLEPEYCDYISLRDQLNQADTRFGKQKDLLLMDNNVFASECFDRIIDEIKECGFGKGATYVPPNQYDIALNNLKGSFNDRAYIKKIVGIYDQISDRLKEEIQADFYLKRENLNLLYAGTATKEAIIAFDEIARPLYDKYFRRGKRVRYIDFNQGVDARFATIEKMRKLSEVNIRPLRIAFDHYSMRDTYEGAVRMAAESGIRDLSNYLLYNFQDRPEELYYRMRLNVELSEELDVRIYSFPMKYHPIDDPAYFRNRDYIGKHWKRKYIRAIQSVLNATKGKVGRGKEFFEAAFGRNEDEFREILIMPESLIINRHKYDKSKRDEFYQGKQSKYDNDNNEYDMTTEKWREKFYALNESQRKQALEIIHKNRFSDSVLAVKDPIVRGVLEFYRVK